MQGNWQLAMVEVEGRSWLPILVEEVEPSYNARLAA
jgi:hypothetical protein